MKKWIKRIGYTLLVLIGIILLLVNIGMISMRYSDLEIGSFFDDAGVNVVILKPTFENVQVRVVSEESGQTDSVLILFIHGAPGSWDAYKRYMIDSSLYNNARLVALDRPGYGESDPRPMVSIVDQSKIIEEVLGLFDYKTAILVGHSYGAPIAGYAEMNDALKVKTSVLIAPLLDPDNEPIFWYSYLSHWRLTSWFLVRELRVAGAEKFSHAESLKEIEGTWENINGRIILIHGMEDALAPPEENIAFAMKHIPAKNLELVTYDDAGHLLIWEKYDDIKSILLRELND